MYLSWDHATLRLFDEELFLDQMAAGETAYCTPAFVNALLAAACVSLSPTGRPRPVPPAADGAEQINYGAVDKSSCARLGPQFYDEAVCRLADEEARGPHLLLVPAAALLCMWCESVGDDQAGSAHTAKALAIARQLGLFTKLPREPHMCDAHSRRMLKGEAIVAWGFYMRQV